MSKTNKYYVVWKGKKSGIYSTWEECKTQIDDFKGALYKSFPSKQEAEKAFSNRPENFIKRKEIATPSTEKPITDSLAVDAACSGNPGVMEYRGVSVADGNEVFTCKFDLGTNNIGEFLAIVHGLSYLKKHNLPNPIYSDSVNAILWIKAKKAKTKLERNSKTESLFQYIERAEQWLKENDYITQILKWDTVRWGEIPADFGRKG